MCTAVLEQFAPESKYVEGSREVILRTSAIKVLQTLLLQSNQGMEEPIQKDTIRTKSRKS